MYGDVIKKQFASPYTCAHRNLHESCVTLNSAIVLGLVSYSQVPVFRMRVRVCRKVYRLFSLRDSIKNKISLLKHGTKVVIDMIQTFNYFFKISWE